MKLDFYQVNSNNDYNNLGFLYAIGRGTAVDVNANEKFFEIKNVPIGFYLFVFKPGYVTKGASIGVLLVEIISQIQSQDILNYMVVIGLRVQLLVLFSLIIQLILYIYHLHPLSLCKIMVVGLHL